MFIYNVTIKVQEPIKDEWLKWLKEEHIPEMLGTGCFDRTTILQLMETDDTEGPTFAIQYETGSKSLYNLYMEKYAPAMRKRSIDKWGDRFIAFRSLLQIID